MKGNAFSKKKNFNFNLEINQSGTKKFDSNLMFELLPGCFFSKGFAEI